jgi:hypothetical protein
MTRLTRCLFLIGLLVTASSVLASPVTWTLQNGTFNTGRTLAGSFVYDADTNIYSNISIVTSAGDTRFDGTPWPGASYTYWDPGAIVMPVLLYASEFPPPNLPTYSGVLAITFAGALTNAGGTRNIVPDGTIIDFTPWGGNGFSPAASFEASVNPITGWISPFRFITGQVTSGSTPPPPPPPPAIPEPATLLLLGTGLGVIGLAAWRRRK